MDTFGHKVRRPKLRWYGHVKSRDEDYVDRKVLEMQLPGKRKRGTTKEEIFACGASEDEVFA